MNNDPTQPDDFDANVRDDIPDIRDPAVLARELNDAAPMVRYFHDEIRKVAKTGVAEDAREVMALKAACYFALLSMYQAWTPTTTWCPCRRQG